jgi:hypothetical protein
MISTRQLTPVMPRLLSPSAPTMPAQCVAGAVRAVAVLVHRVALVGEAAEAVGVVEGAELRVDVHLQVVGPVPHVADEVRVRVVHAAVEDGDDDLLAPLRLVPGGERADVGLGAAVALPRVDEPPLLREERVVGPGRRRGFDGVGAARPARVVELDAEVRLGVLDLGERGVLRGDARGVGVVEVVDGGQPLDRLDLVLDAVVERRGDLLDALLGDARLEAHEHLRLVEVFTVEDRERGMRGRRGRGGLLNGHVVPRRAAPLPALDAAGRGRQHDERRRQRHVNGVVSPVHYLLPLKRLEAGGRLKPAAFKLASSL